MIKLQRSLKGAVKVLLVEHHPLMREVLKRRIDQEPGLQVCGVADTVEDAEAIAQFDVPDLVVSGLMLDGQNGLDLFRHFRVLHPSVPVVIVSRLDNPVYRGAVRREGGRGFVARDALAEQLFEAVGAVLAGGVFFEVPAPGVEPPRGGFWMPDGHHRCCA